MATAEPIRPDFTVLAPDQQERVLRHVRRRRPACLSCGGDDFRVGQALYLGFLFHSEPTDAYMIALTCTASGCPAPRSAINLHAAEFLPT